MIDSSFASVVFSSLSLPKQARHDARIPPPPFGDRVSHGTIRGWRPCLSRYHERFADRVSHGNFTVTSSHRADGSKVASGILMAWGLVETAPLGVWQ